MEKKETHNLLKHSAGIFKGFRLACGAVFFVFLTALSGCLDIPDEPAEKIYLERLDIFVLQEGTADTTLMKIRPSDSSIVKAATYPMQLKNSLSCRWLRVNGDSSVVMGEGYEYTIPASTKTSDIPNAVEVSDEVGNTFLKEFEIVVNLMPVLEPQTTPANGDTLYGNTKTAFKFKWHSYDSDSFDENRLEHTLVIDGVPYSVGQLTEIMQSGFGEGRHTFQVIVSDTFGDADTLSTKTFYVVDTLGRAP